MNCPSSCHWRCSLLFHRLAERWQRVVAEVCTIPEGTLLTSSCSVLSASDLAGKSNVVLVLFKVVEGEKDFVSVAFSHGLGQCTQRGRR